MQSKLSYIFLIALCVTFNTQSKMTIESIFGTDVIEEPVIEELVESIPFQRLKNINQYGSTRYTYSKYDYTRYSHSLGVFILLKRYNASLKEQVAGLLHDISHTVFSHVSDYLYKNTNYQDDIHLWYLKECGLDLVLKKYHYLIEDMDTKNNSFYLLEQSLPDLCADRIEYIIHGGYLEEKLTREDIANLLKHLFFENGLWYFDDATWAKKFAETSLYLTKNLFASEQNIASNTWCAQALQRALDIHELTSYDIHFSTDEHVWQKLKNSNDTSIKKCINYLENYQDHFEVHSEKRENNKHFSPKFRGTNPWVQTQRCMQRLTDIDSDFGKEYFELKNSLSRGFYIFFK